ncbi:MAG: transporter substrate-binding domain-containing protein [Deltaproteobacteria bacterium]|nr:transporter substrate-binding domain-containing protein [Deltaproteobacteria bacterium]
MMKKSILSLVGILLLTILAGCAGMNANTAHTQTSPVLDRIAETGELVVGTAGSMPPLNMTTKDGQVVGIEPDIARYIANAMGVKLRLETMPFAELLPALEAGKVDMVLSNMTITPQRNLNAAFVGPYYVSGKAFLTKLETIALAREAADINSAETTLAVLKGSTSQYFAEKVIPDANLITTDDYDAAVNLVRTGEAHAMIADYPICLVSVYRYPEEGLLTVVTPLTYEPIGIAVPVNDALLVNWLENFLHTLKASGNLETIVDYWLEDAAWLQDLKE